MGRRLRRATFAAPGIMCQNFDHGIVAMNTIASTMWICQFTAWIVRIAPSSSPVSVSRMAPNQPAGDHNDHGSPISPSPTMRSDSAKNPVKTRASNSSSAHRSWDWLSSLSGRIT